jgi:hypothetical protein
MLEARQFQRVTSQIEIQILQAIVHLHLEDIQKAKAIFMAALAQGEPEGYRRIYLDGGQPVAQLLEYCRMVKTENHYNLPTSGFVDSLLDDIKQEMDRMQNAQLVGKNYKNREFNSRLSRRIFCIITLIRRNKGRVRYG